MVAWHLVRVRQLSPGFQASLVIDVSGRFFAVWAFAATEQAALTELVRQLGSKLKSADLSAHKVLVQL